MRKIIFLLLLTSCFIACSSIHNEESSIINLNDNWTFHALDETTNYTANVPGSVHMDLLNLGMIEDPFYRSNEKDQHWISQKNWVYETSFELGQSSIKDESYLVFKGLDTHAEVYLNNALILQANNMFRTWEIEVSKFLQKKNHLKIIFKSPHTYIEEKSQELEYKLPEERAFSRKAPYQFGWDWGPEFVSMGIWKEVYLEVGRNRVIESIYYQTDSIANDQAFLHASLNLQTKKAKDFRINILSEGNIIASKDIQTKKGKNPFHIPINIQNPKLWWSNGLGEAHLYNFEIQIAENNKLVETKKSKVGIRTLKLVQEKDSIGMSFYFELNGLPVFMKGANYIPQDNFLNRVSKKKYERLIQSAVDAHMNMLRVWGGGIYENDLFYDLCDQNGILVWQDFMFACAMYPGDSAFLENVRHEAIDNIKRLRQHPSIALWCGNNEVDEAWHNWGWQRQFNYTEAQLKEIWKSYTDLFHHMLPDLIDELDPSREYWASSPSIGWGRSESLTQGDSHYWGVWWGEQAFEIYEEKVGRFMSEYGFQAFPSLATLDSVLLETDKHLGSEALQTHQKHPRGFELINEYMQRDYQIPDKFEDYAYVSQLLQASGIKTAIEAHRRAMPYCMGTLYWQLNDCWPVISWSSIDYYGNWKALHYQVKRSFNPLLISFEEDEEFIKIYAVSDLPNPVSAQLAINVMDFKGNKIYTDTLKVNISKNTSKLLIEKEIAQLLNGNSRSEVVLNVQLIPDNYAPSSSPFYFTRVKELKLLTVDMNCQISKIDNKSYMIRISADYLAKDVYLDIPGTRTRFEDNYFDVLPNTIKRIKLETDLSLEEIKSRLVIKTLNSASLGKRN